MCVLNGQNIYKDNWPSGNNRRGREQGSECDQAQTPDKRQSAQGQQGSQETPGQTTTVTAIVLTLLVDIDRGTAPAPSVSWGGRPVPRAHAPSASWRCSIAWAHTSSSTWRCSVSSWRCPVSTRGHAITRAHSAAPAVVIIVASAEKSSSSRVTLRGGNCEKWKKITTIDCFKLTVMVIAVTDNTRTQCGYNDGKREP